MNISWVPKWMLPLIPVGIRINYVRDNIGKVWEEKSNRSILDAFEDATDWVDISMGMFESPTTDKIAQDCYMRLEKYILPQMVRRGLI